MESLSPVPASVAVRTSAPFVGFTVFPVTRVNNGAANVNNGAANVNNGAANVNNLGIF